MTIKPGAYPWRNHHNAWRPNAHPLLAVRPELRDAARDADVLSRAIRCCRSTRSSTASPTEAARERLISRFALDVTEPGWALGYAFDIVLRGRAATPMES